MFTVAAPTEPLEDGRTIDRRYHSDIAPNQIGSAPRSVCFFQPSLLATWTRLAPRATAVCYETYKAFVHDRQRARPDPLRSSCLSRPEVRLMAWRGSFRSGWEPCLANPL